MTAENRLDKTGNVTLIEKPAKSPWPIISPEARAAWHEAQVTLGSGYAGDHALVTGWYVNGWEAAHQQPAPDWVKAIPFSLGCLVGHCWECGWTPAACGCGHHRPGSWTPPGPVTAAIPEPHAGHPYPAAEEGAQRAPARSGENPGAPDAEEKAPAEDAPDATKVIPAAKAKTEVMPAVEDGGEQA
jgi:hypothetical protein